MSNLSILRYRHAAYFQGFVNSSRKWHILPTLSRDFSYKILTNSGYIMLDYIYVLYYSISICRHFYGNFRDFKHAVVNRKSCPHIHTQKYPQAVDKPVDILGTYTNQLSICSI